MKYQILIFLATMQKHENEKGIKSINAKSQNVNNKSNMQCCPVNNGEGDTGNYPGIIALTNTH
jgi:hypothetical protein